MRTRRWTQLARSLVTILGALLVVSGAGFAAARTMTGPPWQQPVLSAMGCDTTGGTEMPAPEATETEAPEATETEAPDATETEAPEAGETESPDSTEETPTAADCADDTDSADRADTKAVFAGDCGSAALGETRLTGSSNDADAARAFGALADALSSGQRDHMVQSVRVLLRNCEAHANEGLRNALYHHGLNWVRHYEHELWLEQKFAEKWPDGKPGRGHDATTHGKPGKTDKTHGNPHDADPSWAPGGGSSSSHGNGNGNGK
jgi:hypothetical protein